MADILLGFNSVNESFFNFSPIFLNLIFSESRYSNGISPFSEGANPTHLPNGPSSHTSESKENSSSFM